MSVPEYWNLHGYRYAETNKTTGSKSVSKEESKDVFAQMREQGLIK